jgi:hypothetical protein
MLSYCTDDIVHGALYCTTLLILSVLCSGVTQYFLTGAVFLPSLYMTLHKHFTVN